MHRYLYAAANPFVANNAVRRCCGPLLLVLSLALPIGCSQPARKSTPAAASLTSGDHEFRIRHGGRERSYIVHMPPGATEALPVILAFHGGGGNAIGFKAYSELDRVSDRERFLVVYPNGTGPLPNRLLTWNAGDGCCGYALNNAVNDVGFVATLLFDLESRTPIDRRRVYATGHSNGAIFAHRLGAERSGIIAAIAAVSGSLDLKSFSPSRSVPVLDIHSVDDPRALYNGGLGPPFPGTDTRIVHQPVQSGLDRWIKADGCNATPDTVARKNQDAQSATLIIWRGCRGGAEVAHWKLTGSGHGWPGTSTPAIAEAIVGPQSKLIRAADEVWAFVSRFRLP